MGDLDDLAENLGRYLQAFPSLVRDIFEHFDLDTQIDRLSRAKLLDLVAERSAKVDLHLDVVSNAQLGIVFEDLNRKFAEASNATADERFSREVIRLMFIKDDDVLRKPGVVRSVYDPKAGTGGILKMAQGHLADLRRTLGSVESVETRSVKPGPDTVIKYWCEHPVGKLLLSRAEPKI